MLGLVPGVGDFGVVRREAGRLRVGMERNADGEGETEAPAPGRGQRVRRLVARSNIS